MFTPASRSSIRLKSIGLIISRPAFGNTKALTSRSSIRLRNVKNKNLDKNSNKDKVSKGKKKAIDKSRLEVYTIIIRSLLGYILKSK